MPSVAASRLRQPPSSGPRRAPPRRSQPANGSSSGVARRRAPPSSDSLSSPASARAPARPATSGPWKVDQPQPAHDLEQERRQVGVADVGARAARRASVPVDAGQDAQQAVAAAGEEDRRQSRDRRPARGRRRAARRRRRRRSRVRASEVGRRAPARSPAGAAPRGRPRASRDRPGRTAPRRRRGRRGRTGGGSSRDQREIKEAGEPRKPSSVSRPKPGERSFLWDRRCRRPPATYPEDGPGAPKLRSGRDGRPAYRSPIWSCSAWGLPCPAPSPAGRCALTAPFHPYRRPASRGPPAVYFLLHFPSRRRASPLASMLPVGVRTFLSALALRP